MWAGKQHHYDPFQTSEMGTLGHATVGAHHEPRQEERAVHQRVQFMILNEH